MEHSDNTALKDLLLTETEWDELDSCISALKPFKIYSTRLQSESSTLSDFFGYWISMKISLANKSDILSVNLLGQMNFRHDVLVNNPVLIAGVYLDPRYQRALTSQRELAIETLLSIHRKIKNLALVQRVEDANNESGNSLDDMETNLLHYLDGCNGTDRQQETQDIEMAIRSFNMREPIKSSVLEFWNKRQEQFPGLFELASVLLAIPPTQSTVERSFSAFGLILTSRRTNLGDGILEDILLVRFNFHLLQEQSTQ